MGRADGVKMHDRWRRGRVGVRPLLLLCLLTDGQITLAHILPHPLLLLPLLTDRQITLAHILLLPPIPRASSSVTEILLVQLALAAHGGKELLP